jgi:hypothetical protein
VAQCSSVFTRCRCWRYGFDSPAMEESRDVKQVRDTRCLLVFMSELGSVCVCVCVRLFLHTDFPKEKRGRRTKDGGRRERQNTGTNATRHLKSLFRLLRVLLVSLLLLSFFTECRTTPFFCSCRRASSYFLLCLTLPLSLSLSKPFFLRVIELRRCARGAAKAPHLDFTFTTSTKPVFSPPR